MTVRTCGLSDDRNRSQGSRHDRGHAADSIARISAAAVRHAQVQTSEQHLALAQQTAHEQAQANASPAPALNAPQRAIV